MEFFLLMGDDYINNPEIGSQCHRKRISLGTFYLERRVGNYIRPWQALESDAIVWYSAGQADLSVVVWRSWSEGCLV